MLKKYLSTPNINKDNNIKDNKSNSILLHNIDENYRDNLYESNNINSIIIEN